jgi:hypothetical protein
MSRNGDEDDTTPRFDDKSNTNNNEESSKMRASTDAKLEDLIKRLEKLTAENNKLRRKVKANRTKGGSFSKRRRRLIIWRERLQQRKEMKKQSW